MSAGTWAQFVALFVALVLLGAAARALHGEGLRRRQAPGDRVFLPVERLDLPRCDVDPKREQRWTVYASRSSRSACSFLLFICMQRLQGSLPFNPTGVSAVVPHLSFNTAVSFMTNTNWQSYGGETTMSHLTQMVGLTVQNFVSAAAGMAVMAALIRGSPAPARDARQLLGRPHPYDPAHPAAALARFRLVARRPGRHSELPRAYQLTRSRARRK